METNDTFIIFRDIAIPLITGIVVPAILLFVGRSELNKWRRELVGTKRFELAHQIGVTSIRFKNQYFDAVSPSTFVSVPNPTKSDNQNSQTKQESDEKFNRLEQGRPMIETLDKLLKLSAEAEFLYKEDLRVEIQVFQGEVAQLYGSIHTYFDNISHINRLTPEQISVAEKCQGIIYGSDDTHKQKVVEATEAIKRRMQRYV